MKLLKQKKINLLKNNYFLCYKVSVLNTNELLFENIICFLSNSMLLKILGNNGSGKTTLFNIFLNIKNKSFGYIKLSIANKLIFNNIYNKYMCLLTESKNLITNSEIKIIAKFWYKMFILIYNLQIKTNFQLIQKLNNILVLTHSQNFQNINIEFLSSGQKKRVQFITLFYIFFPLWLIDEPTSALDIKMLKIFNQYLYYHIIFGGTIIYISHEFIPLKTFFLDLNYKTL